MTIEYYLSRGKYYWRVRSNGIIVCRSEQGYLSIDAATVAIVSFLNAVVLDGRKIIVEISQ